jgi:hypothetical protein
MKLIPLTQGKFAKVDDEDYDWLMQRKWICNGRYVLSRRGGMKKRISMHREIMNPPDDMEVDHIDHDGLNNQRCNLRVCTHYQNSQNRTMHKPTHSGYKGVGRHFSKWRATIRVNTIRIRLGRFETKEEAAHAYDDAAIKYFGEFSQLNYPRDATMPEMESGIV